MLGHALELLRELGDLHLAQCQTTSDGGSEERRDPWSAAQQAREALAWQPPDDTRAQRDERGGADLVA